MESAFHLYQATKNEHLLLAGQRMVHDLQQHTFVPGGGYANLRNVIGHDKEDHMSSFFLAETLAYLYLLFDDSFVRNAPYVLGGGGFRLCVTLCACACYHIVLVLFSHPPQCPTHHNVPPTTMCHPPQCPTHHNVPPTTMSHPPPLLLGLFLQQKAIPYQ